MHNKENIERMEHGRDRRCWPEKLLLCRSPRRIIHGVKVWTPYTEQEKSALAFQKVEAALSLLVHYSPARAERVRRMSGVMVFGTTDFIAHYIVRSDICRLWERYVLEPETKAEDIALTLVHEATHAWLFRLGFDYREAIRADIEYLCIRAEYGVARRLPNGTAQVEKCLDRLNFDTKRFADSSFEERKAEELRQLGTPAWVIKIVMFFLRTIHRITKRSTRAFYAGELDR